MASTKQPKKKRRRGRPTVRVMKLDATMEEVAQRMFANAKKPDPSIRVYNKPEASRLGESSDGGGNGT